ncbi:MAG TPA: DNA polymerase III subunit beta [Eubacteriaceae bacterium]|nr:DNA polymerase III subunit beta [Eubacteriaceae bacterium]
MKFTTNKKNLLHAVNIVQKAVSSKSTMPILEGILFQVKEEGIDLMATDMEIGIKTKVEGEVIEEGSIVLSAKLIGDLVRKLPDDTISFDLSDNQTTTIKCKNSVFNIQGESGEDFPQMPEVVGDVQADIPNNLFRSLIKETVFAVAKSDNIPVLTGELLEIENGEMTLVALDGYRLALRKGKTDPDVSLKEVIPERTLSELSRLLTIEDDDIRLSSTKNQILFSLGNTVIVSNLLQGEYINYKQIIPEEGTTKVQINTKELLASCERAALMVRDGKNNLIKMNINGDQLEMESNSDIGDVKEEIPVKREGDGIKIAFNCNYFIDALKVIDEEEVQLEFTTAVSPCVIKPLEGNHFTYLILPVRYIEH